jgi:hypothetical protein
VRDRLNRLVVEQPEVANEVVAVGIPILLDSGEMVRGPEVIVPKEAEGEPATRSGWTPGPTTAGSTCGSPTAAPGSSASGRSSEEVASIPEEDTSSRYLRNRRFWHEDRIIQPGKVVGWILSVEEHGARMKR